jgi:hypothetical protein
MHKFKKDAHSIKSFYGCQELRRDDSWKAETLSLNIYKLEALVFYAHQIYKT